MSGPACPIRGQQTTTAKYRAVSVLLTAAVVSFVCAHFSAVERLVRRRTAVPVYSEAPVETWPDSPANLSWNKTRHESLKADGLSLSPFEAECFEVSQDILDEKLPNPAPASIHVSRRLT